MGLRIIQIDMWAREIGAPRMDFKIGAGQSVFPEWMRINVEVRVEIQSSDGRSAWGCAADWPSFGWLDKRTGIAPQRKLRELLELVLSARDEYGRLPEAKSPFAAWWLAHQAIGESAVGRSAVPLCRAFAEALFERAIVDAWCRLNQVPFHAALAAEQLGLELEKIHPELAERTVSDWLPPEPLGKVFVRHTVGASDPLDDGDCDVGWRLADGQPWTLRDYIRQQGITYFKIKVRGDVPRDLARLQRVWEQIQTLDPRITLDGNEAFADPQALREFVERLAEKLPDLFQRILYIEQPLDRQRPLQAAERAELGRIANRKPLIIDEADGPLDAYRLALADGYRGVSHKNCKGLFKSLANFALAQVRSRRDGEYFLSSEDLTNLPPVALPQDFAVVAALGLPHSERNGHHFFRGLSHLTPGEQTAALKHYPRLYERRGADVFLAIRDGCLDLTDVNHATGLGVACEPDWSAMTPLAKWLARFRDEQPEAG